MTDGAENSRRAERRLWASDARARSRACTARADRAAESAALRKDQVERMLERLEERNPQHAGSLHCIRSTADKQRAAIAAHRHRFYAAGRSDGRLLVKPQNEVGAAGFSVLDSYLRDMAVVQERERIAVHLLDDVIKRVFNAGLTLEGAARLTAKREVRQRIEEAVDELDTVIRAIRDTAFNLPYR